MSMRCLTCGGTNLKKISKNKMRISYICNCGTLYTTPIRKRRPYKKRQKR